MIPKRKHRLRGDGDPSFDGPTASIVAPTDSGYSPAQPDRFLPEVHSGRGSTSGLGSSSGVRTSPTETSSNEGAPLCLPTIGRSSRGSQQQQGNSSITASSGGPSTPVVLPAIASPRR